MKTKITRLIGLTAIGFGVLSFVLHAFCYPHSNFLLLTGLLLVLLGVIYHVTLIKRSGNY